MTDFEKLVALGAEVVGGGLFLKHEALGYFRNGELILTDEGRKLLVADSMLSDASLPRAPRAGRKKAEAVALDLIGGPKINFGDI